MSVYFLATSFLVSLMAAAIFFSAASFCIFFLVRAAYAAFSYSARRSFLIFCIYPANSFLASDPTSAPYTSNLAASLSCFTYLSTDSYRYTSSRSFPSLSNSSCSSRASRMARAFYCRASFYFVSSDSYSSCFTSSRCGIGGKGLSSFNDFGEIGDLSFSDASSLIFCMRLSTSLLKSEPVLSATSGASRTNTASADFSLLMP